MNRERALEDYGGSYEEFMRNEHPETEMERVRRVSHGERDCCVDPDCPVWSDDWLEKEPERHPCAFCGHPDARHRIVDAIRERIEAGEDEFDVLDDYGWEAPKFDYVRRMIAEIDRKPGRNCWKHYEKEKENRHEQ